MLATASTCTGCTAKSSPAASAARSPLQRPVRGRERTPPSVGGAEEGIPEDDRDVVDGEAIPERAEVDDHGAQRDDQKYPLGSHGLERATFRVRSRNISAAPALPRARAAPAS